MVTRPGIRHEHDPAAVTDFAATRHGREVAGEYTSRLKRLDRKIKRLEVIGRRTGRKSVARRLQGLSGKAASTEAAMFRELNLAAKIRGSKKHGPKMKGSKVSLGIHREGHVSHFLTTERS